MSMQSSGTLQLGNNQIHRYDYQALLLENLGIDGKRLVKHLINPLMKYLITCFIKAFVKHLSLNSDLISIRCVCLHCCPQSVIALLSQGRYPQAVQIHQRYTIPLLHGSLSQS